MIIDDALADFRRKFSLRGEFTLQAGETINQVVSREGVATGYGVYVISCCRGGASEILCIGKAGTIRQNGTMKNQGIRKRLTMKQNGEYRRVVFEGWITEGSLTSLHFEWFVTFSDVVRVPPFLAEAELLAAHLESFARLPLYNRAT